MTTGLQSSEKWTDSENKILFQFGNNFKKGTRISWKYHLVTLNALFPHKSLESCKRQYHLIQTQYDKAIKVSKSKKSIKKTFSTKTHSNFSYLQINKPTTYLNALDNRPPIYLIETPISSKAIFLPHSPFAHPPINETPLESVVFQIHPNLIDQLSNYLLCNYRCHAQHSIHLSQQTEDSCFTQTPFSESVDENI
jgi:hypothetical protein